MPSSSSCFLVFLEKVGGAWGFLLSRLHVTAVDVVEFAVAGLQITFLAHHIEEEHGDKDYGEDAHEEEQLVEAGVLAVYLLLLVEARDLLVGLIDFVHELLVLHDVEPLRVVDGVHETEVLPLILLSERGIARLALYLGHVAQGLGDVVEHLLSLRMIDAEADIVLGLVYVA